MNKEKSEMYTQNNITHEYQPLSKSFNYLYMTNNLHNPEKTIKDCFNILYRDGYFLEAIYNILVKYEEFSTDGCYWYYPDLNSPFDDDHFEGVKFAVGFDDPDSTVYVPETVCFEYAQQACSRFIELHPEFKEYIENIIKNWKPLNKEA